MLRTLLATPLALVVACGGVTTSDGEAPSPATSPPETEQSTTPGGSTPAAGEPTGVDQCLGVATTPSCAPAVDVASSDEVFAEIAKLTESAEASTKKDAGEKLRPTPDLHATATIELDVAVFRAAHPSCDANAPEFDPQGKGCVEATFTSEHSRPLWTGNTAWPTALGDLPDGVTCTSTTPNEGCTKLSIAAGTTIRFARSSLRVPFQRLFPHLIHVTRSCAAPCDTDELRCAASATCIATAAFCVLCQGKELEVCACQEGCSAKAEAATCSFATSDDTSVNGTCSAGTCRPN